LYIDEQIIKNLKDLLSNEKNKNIQLINRIKQLEYELYNEREKYKNMNELIEKDKMIIKDLNDKLSEISLVNNNKILELQNIIKAKNDEIDVLKSKLNNDNIDNIHLEGEIIEIEITSIDQTIQKYIRPCKDSDLFVKIEEKLYDEYPQYKNIETFFLVNGRKVLRFKSMKENNIKNGNVIMLNIVE